MLLQTGACVDDRYELMAPLGSGGMASVWLVRHRTLGALFALKVLDAGGPSVQRRIVQEGRIQSTFRHPNIVAVSDVVTVEGMPALVMEYVDGPSLDGLLSARRLDLRQVETLASSIFAGVEAAHARGLVHRDLKPANILVASSDGVLTPKIADFGLARVLDAETAHRATRSGAAMGTPAYMAPEQIRDAKTAGVPSDVFALGAVLYELTTGARAFPSDDILETFACIAAGRYVSPRALAPDLPDRMVRAIDGALRPEVADRIPTVAHLAAVWSGAADGWEGQAPALRVRVPDRGAWSPADLGEIRRMGAGSEKTWSGTDAPGSSPGETWTGSVELSMRPSSATVGESAPPEISSARRHPGSWGLIGIAVLLTAAATGGVGVLLWPDDPTPPPQQLQRPQPEPVAAEVRSAEPVAPAVPEPAAAPPEPPEHPEVAASHAVQPRAPSPEPTALEPQQGQEEAPAVAEAPPPPAEAPAHAGPPPGAALVRVEGDAERVWLRAPTGDVRPGPVAAGTYRVHAFFAGATEGIDVTSLTVEAGQRVVLTCHSASLRCRSRIE